MILMNNTEAIILAGGMGTRLRAAVPDLPKCMAPVNGRPFIGLVLDSFLQQGVTKFILSLGYKAEVIIDFVNAHYSTLNVKYSVEEEPLGTGGAILLACRKATEKDVIACNGDTLFNIDLMKLLGFHSMSGAHCTLSLKPMKNFDRYGVVELNNDYSIRSFREKQHYEQGLINGGVYALNVGKFLNESLSGNFSFERNYLETLYTKRRMFGVVQDKYFIDIGIPEDYERAQRERVTES